jgi:hypothetical protein
MRESKYSGGFLDEVLEQAMGQKTYAENPMDGIQDKKRGSSSTCVCDVNGQWKHKVIVYGISSKLYKFRIDFFYTK